MILHCNFEEVTALTHGAHSFLERAPGAESGVIAPSRSRAMVEALLPRLEGDVSIECLQEQRRVQGALEVIVEHLRVEMETQVVATHAADEIAVAAYFDFAHSLSVLGRAREMGEEMVALIELMTGGPASPALARDIKFPD
jgi:hypothetical protein